MTGVVREQNLEKQMGCMAGFLQIFDRHQALAGKRLYSAKRLPPSSTVSDSPPESEQIIGSPMAGPMPSPDRFKQSSVTEPRSPLPETLTPRAEVQSKALPLPIFELKEGSKSSWKFCKEAPRLSLDSRATFDSKGSLKAREIPTTATFLSGSRHGVEDADSDKQRRSPSVIARLMGLERLPGSDPDPDKKPELRRSASESRAGSRDLFQYRVVDGITVQSKQQLTATSNISTNVTAPNGVVKVQTSNVSVRNARAEPARVGRQRKSFFDSADFFPDPKQTVTIYGEIERRLRMRGIDEPSKDLETLKQILEALQLKGLLHSKKPSSQINHRNFVHDRSFSHDESPIVVIKPARPTSPMNRPGRIGSDSPSPRARRDSNLHGETFPAMSPRRGRPVTERDVRSQTRGENSKPQSPRDRNVRSPNRKPLSVETHRRVPPVQSPKVSTRRNNQDQMANRSPRNRKSTVEIYQKVDKVFVPPAEDELSIISESSFSTPSQTDTERSKAEEYKEGRNLLERCDKLLHSIAEMTAATAELQPSPVSVLDASFYKEESSPSPIMKRSVEFKDQLSELEDDIWSIAISPIESKSGEHSSDDCDFFYICDILRASNYLPEESDVFLLLEKQQYLKGKDTSKASMLKRKLIFDTISEILNRNNQLPPWKAISWTNPTSGQSSLQQIWMEFQRIRERESSDDLFEVICSMLKKDLAGDATNGWGDCPVEMSESVLDIERLIFKDLIGETIQDLAAFSGKCHHQVPVPRRKLVF